MRSASFRIAAATMRARSDRSVRGEPCEARVRECGTLHARRKRTATARRRYREEVADNVRSGLRVALHCTHPGCGEEVVVRAQRVHGDGATFEIRPPDGWSRVRENDASRGAPYEVPALCPLHRPDLRAFLARSLGEIRQVTETMKGVRARALRARLERCAHAIERWRSAPPTEEQVGAMTHIVAELREAVGLPPGLVSGVRKSTRTRRD
jgi:hypothetical protein